MMRIRCFVFAVLYGAAFLGANSAWADFAKAEATRQGTMLKLQFQEPAKADATAFQDLEGAPLDLSAWHGKWLVVNFWATWCAPCKKEMPYLDALNVELGGENFAVLTIATGRNNPQAMRRFFEDAEINSLPLFRDPDFSLADGNGVRGLPYTLVIDPDGHIVARMVGDADWASDSAFEVIKALMDQNTRG